ncbi:MAG: hypothetical protein WBD36_09305 [Bacteroidota bacterium]
MKKVAMLLVCMMVASGVAMSQGFKVTSVGGALNFNGLLGPGGATEAQSSGGVGFGFGPFLGVNAKVRAMGGPQMVRWTGAVGYDIYQAEGSTFKATQGVLAIELGAEYPLKEMKMGAMSLWPYLSGALALNMFPGATVESKVAGFTVGTIDSKTRVGLVIGAGAEYVMKEGLSIDAGLKFGIANLIGKGASGTKDVLYTSSTTSNEEGTWMPLTLRLGINYTLK